VHLHLFLATPEEEGLLAPRQRLEEAHHMVVALEVLRMPRSAEPLQIGRRGTGHEADRGNAPGDQRLIGDFTGSQRAVDILAQDIDRPIGYPEIELDIGIAVIKIAECRDEDEVGERAGHLDAELA
jgi:hypothetical protein